MAGSDIPDMAGRKMRKRRTQAIGKHYAFYSNAIINFFQEWKMIKDPNQVI